jgi:hypothetical protein
VVPQIHIQRNVLFPVFVHYFPAVIRAFGVLYLHIDVSEKAVATKTSGFEFVVRNSHRL